MIFRYGKASKKRFFVDRKTPLRRLLDAIMMLTFFDAVVIAIATCSYRDSNMMLSSCVHVVIKLATCCQFEVLSSGVNKVRGESAYLCKKASSPHEDRFSERRHFIREEGKKSEHTSVGLTCASCHHLAYGHKKRSTAVLQPLLTLNLIL